MKKLHLSAYETIHPPSHSFVCITSHPTVPSNIQQSLNIPSISCVHQPTIRSHIQRVYTSIPFVRKSNSSSLSHSHASPFAHTFAHISVNHSFAPSTAHPSFMLMPVHSFIYTAHKAANHSSAHTAADHPNNSINSHRPQQHTQKTSKARMRAFIQPYTIHRSPTENSIHKFTSHRRPFIRTIRITPLAPSVLPAVLITLPCRCRRRLNFPLPAPLGSDLSTRSTLSPPSVLSRFSFPPRSNPFTSKADNSPNASMKSANDSFSIGFSSSDKSSSPTVEFIVSDVRPSTPLLRCCTVAFSSIV